MGSSATCVSVFSLLFLTCSAASAAPQAYYFRGSWAQTGLPYLDADLGEAFDGVLIYDPDPANTLDITNLPDTHVDFPGYQSIYAFRSPTTPDPVQLPIGPNGLNFLRVYREDTDSYGVLPRARTNSDGSPRTSPFIGKMTNGVPDPFGGPIGWDVFDSVDQLSAVDLGGGLSRRINFAFIDPSGTSLPDQSLPPSLDLADWVPAAPWGIDIDGNTGIINPSDPNVPGQLREIPFGDANLDGHVTGADYTIWADNFNRPTQAAWIHGDFNVDGQVTGADYTIWADHFGASAAPIPTPEPSSLTLASLLGVLFAARLRRLARRL